MRMSWGGGVAREDGQIAQLILGGLMLTAAVLGLSSHFLGFVPVALPAFGIFQKKRREKQKVRVYMDGCFDLMHYGHSNALRQARELGDELVVGVVSDEEIVSNKGPPVMSMDERLVMVKSVKWVDEVIPDAPYAINEEFMNKLFTHYRIDFIIHGDDPCLLPDGSDAYAHAKKAGRYKQIKRTEGVSSTDIVGRLLLCVRDRPSSNNEFPNHASLQRQFSHGRGNGPENGQISRTQISHFLPTSRRIVQFSNGKAPKPDARIIYIVGAFDLFHAGHVEILRAARELGDFLLVGIHTDQTVSSRRGKHHPIMNLHERSLSVLSCRYADEVIIGAPWEVTSDMITTFNISLVVHGSVGETYDMSNREFDPYASAKEMGRYKVIESPLDITTSTIIKRIVANHESYMKRNEKKVESERKYYANKTFINGD